MAGYNLNFNEKNIKLSQKNRKDAMLSSDIVLWRLQYSITELKFLETRQKYGIGTSQIHQQLFYIPRDQERFYICFELRGIHKLRWQARGGG